MFWPVFQSGLLKKPKEHWSRSQWSPVKSSYMTRSFVLFDLSVLSTRCASSKPFHRYFERNAVLVCFSYDCTWMELKELRNILGCVYFEWFCKLFVAGNLFNIKIWWKKTFACVTFFKKHKGYINVYRVLSGTYTVTETFILVTWRSGFEQVVLKPPVCDCGLKGFPH